MAESAWLIASQSFPAMSFDLDGAPVALTAASQYLRSATLARSLIGTVAARATAVSGDTHTIVILRNRRIRWSATGGNFEIDLGAGSILQNALGAANDTYSGASSYDFELVSPMLWSPGYQATPNTIDGVNGYTVPHQSQRKSSDGTQVQCDHYGSEIWNDLSWTHILPERMRVVDSAPGGGTFHEFFEQYAMLRRRFLWYPDIFEDDESTTAVTWVTARGPFVLRPEFSGDWYRRNVPFAEHSSPLDLPIHRVAEYA
jgi:hypothetical protein